MAVGDDGLDRGTRTTKQSWKAPLGGHFDTTSSCQGASMRTKATR